jgi:hypothetical protein
VARPDAGTAAHGRTAAVAPPGAKQQMGRMERMALSGALAGVAQHVGPEERVDLLFGIDGKQAVVALTDRRLLAVYGMVGRSYSIEYSAINQIQAGLTKVEIDSSGVNLTVKSVTRRDELVTALNERRRTPSAAAAPAASETAEDPVELLAKLGELRDAGVLTEEEFATKKSELLGRM